MAANTSFGDSKLMETEMLNSSAQATPDERGHKTKGVRAFVDCLPLMPPVEMAEELERSGYKGQPRQKAALSLMAYRHIRRLKRIHVEGEPRSNLPPKQNVLMLGPTGCGKTYLVELLFERLLGVPTIIADATTFTERGYVGDDVSMMLTRLVETAGCDPALAACGVVCLDEFDKLASASSSARFAGQGTTKDVSGYGVQRELLTLIEGTDAQAPMDYGFSHHGPRLGLSTKDIPFIACGAFSELNLARKLANRPIGFAGDASLDPTPGAVPDVSVFQKYGFIPELIGRFSQTLTFPPLDNPTLRTILLENVFPRFQNEFRAEGIDLRVTDMALKHIVDQAEARRTGARGLHSELVGIIEQAAYETFMRQKDISMTITAEDGKLACVTGPVASRRRAPRKSVPRATPRDYPSQDTGRERASSSP